ncbi:hypothetical protein B0H17DRAFT_1207990 [Mycena rosella]|uniref:DUF6532 domain-containing protein n=1 Tax=Mycena rosella TaxID=1033263 RepID=A0AAD7D268_MYCRO|nr:hypothetical protein B0H17DRAFT_1207990 [Mycena rosella]
MSAEDFATNNETDSSPIPAGRGQRPHIPTAAIEQYNNAEAKKLVSRANQARRNTGSSVTGAVATTSNGQQASHAVPTIDPAAYLCLSFHAYPDHQNQYYTLPQQQQPQSSPNPFNSGYGMPSSVPWERGLSNNLLYTIGEAPSPGAARGRASLHPDTNIFPPFNTNAVPGFDAEEQDKMYADPHADLSDDTDDAPAPDTGSTSATPFKPVPNSSGSSLSNILNNTQSTPQNLRVFPQSTANMSSTPVQALPPRILCRAFKQPTGPLTASSPTPSTSIAHSSPAQLSHRQPLLRHVNIFGPGFHDLRQRPRSPQVPRAADVSEKENRVHSLSDDEDKAEAARPAKKSRKESAACSISNVASNRIPIIELSYDYICLMVQTEEGKMWLNNRIALAQFVQEAFDYGVTELKLDPFVFKESPVDEVEQDLGRERIYSTRGWWKEVARDVVAGPDGFGFEHCAAKALKETQERVATANRDRVAVLLDRSAHVYRDPWDRTTKGSMYQHASIQHTIELAVFDGLLSDGMQHADYFDDTMPQGYNPADESQPLHKPTFSLVTTALDVISIRGAINEWSSGHWVSEPFYRKIYKVQFDAELVTLRAWHKFTSNPTKIEGNVRMVPPSFLARTFQEEVFAKARYEVLKTIVAPVPSEATMDDADFALNQ